MNNKLYTAYFAGSQYDSNGDKYEMIIVTKWKDQTDNSPEEGHKRYYCRDASRFDSFYKNEEWCKNIYENFQENTVLDHIISLKVCNFEERSRALLHNALVLLADTTFYECTDGKKWLEMIYRKLETSEEELRKRGISVNEDGEVFYI